MAGHSGAALAPQRRGAPACRRLREPDRGYCHPEAHGYLWRRPPHRARARRGCWCNCGLGQTG
eukprot:6743567-Lingulodinium_polyedra.AAC.1